MKRLLLLLWVLAFATAVAAAPPSPLPRAASPQSVGMSAERLQRIDRWLEEEIGAQHKSGAVGLIARHGRIVWEKAFGYTDFARRAPLRTNALFRLYSMTKPITSVALLTLYEQGRLQLTDPLERFVPAFKDVGVYGGTDSLGHVVLHPPRRPISVQDVFRHTAGFTYGGYFEDTPVDKAYAAAGIGYAQLDSLDELVQKLAKMPLLSEPGTRFTYSFAHDVQAYLVEEISGQHFADYCRRTIFEPLGMRDTVFGEPEDLRGRFPTLYQPDGHGGMAAVPAEQDEYRRLGAHPFGGISLSATIEDYLRFAQMLLNGGELNGVRILAPQTVALMSSNNLPPGTEKPDWMQGLGYGLGVAVVEDPAQAGNLGSPGEYGWPGVATTFFTVNPKEDLVALLFAQQRPRDVRFDEIFRTLVYQSLLDRPDASAQQRQR
jgi:CubicO group peptidase (beta-lactamase class C family)